MRTETGQLRPARITALGSGTTINCTVKGGESYVNLPKWTRTTPATPGWVRT